MISFGFWLLGKAQSLFQLLITHWRIVLVVLMALTIWHYKSAYEAEQKAFQSYLAKVKADSDERNRENQEKEHRYAVETIKLKNQHASIIEHLKGQYNATLKNKDTAITNSNAFRDSLRRKLADATERLPEHSVGSIRLAEIGEYSNTADTGRDAELSTVKFACAITTADYNTLYDRCDAANKIWTGVQ